jgi:predicted Rossmann fold nucleotide-binding protein DprA/Smf involved in DNA uptake
LPGYINPDTVVQTLEEIAHEKLIISEREVKKDPKKEKEKEINKVVSAFGSTLVIKKD